MAGVPGLAVDRLAELLFSVYTAPPALDSRALCSLLDFLQQRFFARLDGGWTADVRKLHSSVLKLFVVRALQAGRREKAMELFERESERLLAFGDDWTPWFLLPYLRSPAADRRFAVFFTREWAEALALSSRNLLSSVFAALPLPQLGRLAAERASGRQLEARLAAAAARVALLQAELASTRGDEALPPPPASPPPAAAPPHGALLSGLLRDGSEAAEAAPGEEVEGRRAPAAERAPAPGVSTFSGHSSAITACRFSPDGASVASASADGTVRLWGCAADAGPGSAAAARSATLYCGAALGALAWEPRASRLLLLGAGGGGGGVRAWDAEAQRIVGQSAPPPLGAPPAPVLALAASPCGTAFALAAAGGAALWSLRSFAPLTHLEGAAGGARALALAYNHNGKLLAAACADGAVRLYDSGGGARAALMSWEAGPAGGCAALQFGADGNSLLSLAADGSLTEWSLLSGRAPLRRTSLLALQPQEVPRRLELALHSRGRAALACGDGGTGASPPRRGPQRSALTPRQLRRWSRCRREAPSLAPCGRCRRAWTGRRAALTGTRRAWWRWWAARTPPCAPWARRRCRRRRRGSWTGRWARLGWLGSGKLRTHKTEVTRGSGVEVFFLHRGTRRHSCRRPCLRRRRLRRRHRGLRGRCSPARRRPLLVRVVHLYITLHLPCFARRRGGLSGGLSSGFCLFRSGAVRLGARLARRSRLAFLSLALALAPAPLRLRRQVRGARHRRLQEVERLRPLQRCLEVRASQQLRLALLRNLRRLARQRGEEELHRPPWARSRRAEAAARLQQAHPAQAACTG